MKSTKLKTTTRVAMMGIAAAALGVATVTVVDANANDPRPVGVGPGMATPSYPAVENSTPATALSARTLYGLRTMHRVDVTPVVTDSVSTKIGAEEAQILATSQFHFVNDGGRVAEVALARVTTVGQGVESADGKITPDLDHRLVWLIVFDHVRVRVGGGPRILDAQGHPKPQPANVAQNAVMVVYVNPESGKVLGGAQW